MGGPYEIVKTSKGVYSIKHTETGEIMHNPLGPYDEAMALYLNQSGIHEDVLSDRETIVFDVGLGAWTNAILTLDAFLKEKSTSQLKLHSFEIDMRLPVFTLKHLDHFEFLMPYRDAIKSIVEYGRWQSECGRVDWHLHEKDFKHELPCLGLRAHYVWYDVYSYHVDLSNWGVESFKTLYENMDLDRKNCLITYTRSTPIRVALLMAGFFVGQGIALGEKEETTISSTQLDSLENPLGKRWFERFLRSDSKIPFDYEGNMALLVKKMKGHRQFREFLL